MGSKYSSVTITGFNSGPPPDDASTGSDNQIAWAKHIGKIGNPLKAGVEAVNTALVTAFDYSARSVSAADTTVAGDHCRTVQISSTVTSSIQISLGDAATMAAGYIVTVANQSNVACTIDCATATDTINGTTPAITIVPFESLTFLVNAAASGYNIVGRGLEASTFKNSTVAVGSAVSLTNGVAKTVTSLSLEPGRWLISASGSFVAASTTNITALVLSVSETTDTVDSSTTDRYQILRYPGGAVLGSSDSYILAPLHMQKLIETSAKTQFMVARGDFTVSTLAAYGKIWAHRA